MAKAGPTVESPLAQQLHSLASCAPSDAPVVSLYLNLTPNANGRDAYDVFCRRIFTDTLESSSAPDERAAMAQAFERIQDYLDSHVQPSANGLAIFASAGPDGLFEAVQLAAPIEEHEFFVGDVPHVFPLARLIDQNPRYAALLLDSNQARIIVFGLGEIEGREEVTGVKTKRHSKGGWSQARFQRSIDNAQMHHVKEVVETLDTIVRAEGIQHVVVAGDEAIVARLREELPAQLAEKVVDVLRFDRAAGEEEIVADALEALRRKDSETDAMRVAEVLDAWRARGLGVAGREGTRHALERGQVDELLIAASPEEAEVSNELVTRAAQTGARVRIIEDPELLREHGGVAAALRFRV
jgi:peptide chain release factor subunit 1